MPSGQEACDWRCDWRWDLLLMQGLWSEGAHIEEVHVSPNRPWAVITRARMSEQRRRVRAQPPLLFCQRLC